MGLSPRAGMRSDWFGLLIRLSLVCGDDTLPTPLLTLCFRDITYVPLSIDCARLLDPPSELGPRLQIWTGSSSVGHSGLAWTPRP